MAAKQHAHQVTEPPYVACSRDTVPRSKWSKWLCEMQTKSSLGRTEASSFGAGTTRLRMQHVPVVHLLDAQQIYCTHAPWPAGSPGAHPLHRAAPI